MSRRQRFLAALFDRDATLVEDVPYNGDPAVVRRMADALFHRGPDEDGYFDRPPLALASRRLSIVGLKDGRQPIANEDGTVRVVYNGELFDYVEQRADLEKRGHRFATHCDTEVIPHLWEEHQEETFLHDCHRRTEKSA